MFHRDFVSWILACLTMLTAWTPLMADGAPLTVHALWSHQSVRPGETIELTVQLKLADGWHINADASQVREVDGLKPVATSVHFSRQPRGFVPQPAIYPAAQAMKVSFADSPVMLFGDGQVIRLAVKTSTDVAAGEALFELAIHHQACDDQTCRLPATLKVPLSLRVAPDSAMTISQEFQNLLAASRTSLKTPTTEGSRGNSDENQARAGKGGEKTGETGEGGGGGDV